MVFRKLATVVLEPVADDEIIGFEQQVVGKDLVKGLLGNGNVGRLVFYNEAGPHLEVVEQGVGSQCLVANSHPHLVCQQRSGIAFVGNEVVDEVLAYPLFGSEGDITAPQSVENRWMGTGSGYLDVEIG